MKKVSKIMLENFRVFLGKNEIDFNNSDGNPADFVCIYGKNGFGKTSLFDGLEWFFTGDIDLLKKDLKANVDKYNGNILKCKYAEEGKKAGVGIQYSDGDTGYRTVVKQRTMINDYGKGKASGSCRTMLDKKQILPHSKIDNFVYATKPSQMYKEWGNFWDTDNRKREIFESVYNVCKKIRNEIASYTDKLKETDSKLEELDIQQKVKRYNESVEKYNALILEDIPKLPYIKHIENNKIVINADGFDIKIKEKLNAYINEQTLINEQCKFLQKYFLEYQKFVKQQQELLDRKKRWKKIIEQCKTKRRLLLQQKELGEEANRYKDSKETITTLFDEKWFEAYQKYNADKIQHKNMEEQLEQCKIEIKKITANIEILQENIGDGSKKKKKIQQKCAEWKEQISQLENQEATLCSQEVLDQLVQKKKTLDEQKQIYEKELYYLDKAVVGEYNEFLQSLTQTEIMQYEWIAKWQDYEKEFADVLKKAKAKEKEEKDIYEAMQKNVSSLDALLTLAKREIQKSTICECPVCKSKFNTKKELLSKIDISAQQEKLGLLKMRWDSAVQKSTKAEEEYKKCCDTIKKSIGMRRFTIRQLIAECEKGKNQHQKEWDEKQEIIQRVKEKKRQIKQDVYEEMGIEIEKLSMQILEKECEKQVSMLEKILDENKKNQKVQQEKKKNFEQAVKEKEFIAGTLKRKIEDFDENLSNKQKRENMSQREIYSYEDFNAVVKRYEEKIQQYELEKKEIEKLVEKYRIYYADNIEKYIALLEKTKINIPEWLEYYDQYKKKLFGRKELSLARIVVYQQKSQVNTDKAQEKLKIWNGCMSDIIVKEFVKEYNQILEKKIQLEENKVFSENKKKIAENLFVTVKTQLEDYIKKVFGGITISQIYSKIQPHKRFTKLQYEININEDSGIPELYMKVLNNEKEDLMPELFFSSAQLNTVALSMFLGGALSTANPNVQSIFIDDPVGHFDDLNVLSFIDVLRTIITETGWQIVISTHEESFYELMKVKLSPRYYNSKFFVFQEEGKIKEDVKFGW